MTHRWQSIGPKGRAAVIATSVLVLDQATKWTVMKTMELGAERVVLDGFFKFVHWGNTGAAWSAFRHQNGWLALFSGAAMVALWHFRRHFEFHRMGGQVALGLLFGGILGNLIDRLLHEHVVDFLRFYWNRRSGDEIGFPAFNVADSAICTAVGLLLLMSWQTDAKADEREPSAAE